VRRFSLTRPRIDWSGYLRERYAGARLSDDQTAAVRWLAAQPGGPAKIAAIAEDWSSDCRRDLPYLARLAEAGGLELRVFVRDGDTMLRKGLPDPAAGGNADLVVAYANDVKVRALGVPPDAIDRLGAVSETVAEAMADGVRTRSNADVGVGITGIAGPGGGSPEKPVGTVALAVSTRTERRVRLSRFHGEREQVKFQASQAGLDMVRRVLMGVSSSPATRPAGDPRGTAAT